MKQQFDCFKNVACFQNPDSKLKTFELWNLSLESDEFFHIKGQNK